MSVWKAFVNLFDKVQELSFGDEKTGLGAVDVRIDEVKVPVAVLNLAVVEYCSGKWLRPLLADELVWELADSGERCEFEVAWSCFATTCVESEVRVGGLVRGWMRPILWRSIALDLDLLRRWRPPARGRLAMRPVEDRGHLVFAQ